MAPSSISCLAATGASRKRCCETTDRRTPAARQAATISAHSVADWAIGFSTSRCRPAAAAASVWAEVAGRRRGEDDRVDVVTGQERVQVRLERDAEVGGQRRAARARR